MSLKTGLYHFLKVERDSPFGYFLSDGDEDVLLHYSELNNQEIKVGEKVNVFLFNDHKGRATATLNKPIITLGETDFLEVKSYQPKMGFFLDNGIDKQILLPLAELPEDKAIWPSFEDKLLVRLTHDKQERLLAELVKEEKEIDNYIAKNRTSDDETKLFGKTEFVKGIVIRHLIAGVHLYLENHQIGFLHSSEQLYELRLGQEVKVRKTFTRDDGKINMSMRPSKEISRVDDAERILEILQSRGGAMPYWDKTPPDIITQKFNLSKAAFKRALGKLMKEGLVYQADGWTYLKEQNR